MSTPRITLYSTRKCPACRQARAYLKQRGLTFHEFDVSTNLRAQKALARLGARSVPTILIGDARVEGFDLGRLERLLGKG